MKKIKVMLKLLDLIIIVVVKNLLNSQKNYLNLKNCQKMRVYLKLIFKKPD